MKKRGQQYLTIGIIVLILVIALVIMFWPKSVDADVETAKCIGENSILYTQIGCHHCEDQEAMFGNNTEYLNIFLCNTDWSKCGHIQGTPAWEIEGTTYAGVMSIKELKELTGC